MSKNINLSIYIESNISKTKGDGRGNIGVEVLR